MKIRSLSVLLLVFALLVPVELGAFGSALQAAKPPAISHITPPDTPSATSTVTSSVEISHYLLDELAAASAPVSFLAILTEQPDPSTVAEAAMLAARPAADGLHAADSSLAGDELRAALYAYLTAEAERSQAPLRAWLDENDIPYRPYYLVNMIEIRGDAEVVAALGTRADITRLVANPRIDEASNLSRLAQIAEQASTLYPDEPQTGIEYTRAPAVWELGFRGAGVVVAGGDTGVQWDHPGLIAKYRGWDGETVSHDYHWLDAWRAEDQAESRTPCAEATGACDDWGHGTHTLGTMVADPAASDPRPIGMAPDAQWIACRNMLDNFGTPAKYTDCFQFFLAPYPQDGDPFVDGDPALGADIVNNSWGCPASEGCDADSLRDVVEMVKAAGMFVAASAGNSGTGGCSTVHTPPANHAATFSVGAHNLSGTIAPFSSRGPVTVDGSGRLKPDLVAPGVNIYSTYRNNSYASLLGTSMAAPHVAGAVALLWSAVPALQGDVRMTEEILLKSATPVLNNTCDAGEPATSPNNTYGYGRLDAYRAVHMALTPWEVRVRVSAPGGVPLEGVEVTLTDELTGFVRGTLTGEDGWARWSVVYSGAYACRVWRASQDVGSTSISMRATMGDFEEGDEFLTVESCVFEEVAQPAESRLFAPALERHAE